MFSKGFSLLFNKLMEIYLVNVYEFECEYLKEIGDVKECEL